MDGPQITVHKQSHYLPTSILGKDGQGRTLVACPFCGDEAYVDPDRGNMVICPTGDAMRQLLDSAMEAFDGVS